MNMRENREYEARPYPAGLVSPADIVSFFWRHKGKILLTLVLVVAGVMTLTARTPKIYQANAKLLNRMGRESLALDPSVSGPTLDVQQNRESEINSELAILQSRYLAERVVDQIGPERLLHPEAHPGAAAQEVVNGIKAPASSGLLARLGLDSPLPARERAIEKFMKGLTIEAESKSNILTARFQTYDPQVAQAALDKLIAAYLERHIELYGTQAPMQFFDDQMRKAQTTLQQKEDELKQFRAAHGIVTLDKQQNGLLERIDRLRNDLADADGQIAAAQARAGSLTRSLGKQAEHIELSRVVGKANNAADSIKGKLVELRQKESELAERYPGDARPLTGVRGQIKLAEAALAKEQETLTEVTTGVDTTHQALQLALENEQAQLRAQSARKETLVAELERQQQALTELAGQETALARLQREQNQAESEYTSSYESYQRARTQTTLARDKVSNISIVQPPAASLKPVKPNKPLMLGLALILGTLAGVCLALIAEYNRRGGAELDERMRDEPSGASHPAEPLVPTGLSKP